MRPFLLLSIRAEEAAAREEYDAFCRFLEVSPAELHTRSLASGPLGDVVLEDWSGILLGGGAFTVSDPERVKSAAQRHAEADLGALLDRVVAADFPFLGACYGIGTLGTHQGGVVDTSHPEPVGPLSVTLTDAGLADPLFADVPRSFTAYGGHKEAISLLPAHATLLATAAACPVQAFRVGEHVYATQFHPELDLPGLLTRISVYATHGYFDPADADRLRDTARAVAVTHPGTLLRNFARRYAR
ncbi:glutamine amidotransferase [Nocardioides sp. cx-173]|uniref:glutamine amidotransferase n=1 Tax=Nocardioides sp. cx-173 TaxID=2898796 RepID=UPI001E60FA77|nr:glutamine amidotransferase [Nocardioides sp. cx-173]MCD4525760.1 glutamine amidotransferase [Nocardioides sp. cx-173]UGB39921.1 glutamine amidotransferase [Nocardioides sp. cx-173]